MEVMRSLECRPEDREAEFREDIERGRRAKIALEVLKEIFDEHRENIIQLFENEIYNTTDYELHDLLAELRVMKRFRSNCNNMIQRGEIAEEALSNGE